MPARTTLSTPVTGHLDRREQTASSGLDRLDLLAAFGVSLLHLAVAAYYTIVRGVSIVADPARNNWDWFWQTLPMESLRTDLWRSLWYLHAQPPLYNLWGGILGEVFYPQHLQALHAANVILGALLSGMLYIIILQLIRRRAVAFVWALILALNPALFLYESYILYSLFSAFLVVLTVFWLAWHRITRSALALYAFVLSLNLLILTRSVYQVVLLPLALVLVWLLAQQAERKKVLAIGAAICLLSLGWCLKNDAVFGFFGSSSWSGMGLWRAASLDYSPSELRTLYEQNMIDQVVVDRAAFSPPSTYVGYGFDRTSDEPVLSRDDFNNVNVPDIARAYARNSVRLILRDPARYLRSAYAGYLLFSKPSSQYKHLPLNAAKIAAHEQFYANVLQGHLLVSGGKVSFGTFQFFLLPVALLLYGIEFVVQWRKVRGRFGDAIRHDAIMAWCFVMIVYTVLISCMTEYGEQDRFRFLVEQVVWVFIPLIFARGVTALRRR